MNPVELPEKRHPMIRIVDRVAGKVQEQKGHQELEPRVRQDRPIQQPTGLEGHFCRQTQERQSNQKEQPAREHIDHRLLNPQPLGPPRDEKAQPQEERHGASLQEWGPGHHGLLFHLNQCHSRNPFRHDVFPQNRDAELLSVGARLTGHPPCFR